MDTRRNRTLDLEPGELLHLPHALGTVVRVNRGVVWLTQHGDVRDIVLGPGDSWLVEHAGLTLVQAQRSAAVTVTGPGARLAHRHNQRPSLLARISGWLAQPGALLDRRVPYF